MCYFRRFSGSWQLNFLIICQAKHWGRGKGLPGHSWFSRLKLPALNLANHFHTVLSLHYKQCIAYLPFVRQFCHCGKRKALNALAIMNLFASIFKAVFNWLKLTNHNQTFSKYAWSKSSLLEYVCMPFVFNRSDIFRYTLMPFIKNW